MIQISGCFFYLTSIEICESTSVQSGGQQFNMSELFCKRDSKLPMFQGLVNLAKITQLVCCELVVLTKDGLKKALTRNVGIGSQALQMKNGRFDHWQSFWSRRCKITLPIERDLSLVIRERFCKADQR